MGLQPTHENKNDMNERKAFKKEDERTQMVMSECYREFAKEAHHGQTRRDGRTPYFDHCEQVAYRLDPEDHIGKSVAYLHDIIEDTEETSESLLEKGVHPQVVRAVVALTKVEGEVYLDYLMSVKKNEIATRVKIADMISNLADSPTREQIKKYAKGLVYLTS